MSVQILSAFLTTQPHWHCVMHPRTGKAAQPVVLAWLAQQLGCAPECLRIVRQPHGRPCLQIDGANDDNMGLGALDVNWSHSGNRLLMAAARGVRVGVDIERIRPRNNALAIAARYFHPLEYQWLAGIDAALRSAVFLRIWCAKEALLKAHGRGIAFGLQRFAVLDVAGQLQLVSGAAGLQVDDGWQLQEIGAAPGYCAVLASRQSAPAPASMPASTQ